MNGNDKINNAMLGALMAMNETTAAFERLDAAFDSLYAAAQDLEEFAPLAESFKLTQADVCGSAEHLAVLRDRMRAEIVGIMV